VSKFKVNKCRRIGDPSAEQPWLRKRRERNRKRDRISKESRRINRE